MIGVYERYLVWNRNQKETETAMEYITELRQLAQSCKLKSITPDQLIRDKFICGVRNDALQGRLLREHGMSLQKCVELCRDVEQTREQAAIIAQNCHW